MSQETHEKLRGVFSSQEIRKVGTGTTTRRTVAKTFWFAEEDEQGKLYIQSINSNYIPTGSRRYITKDELIETYSPEPEFYIQSVFPKMRQLNETIDRADCAREHGENFSAEFEYGNALEVDVDNVRANFGIGLTYLARGDTDKAENIFTRLVNLEGAFEEEHKHLFNEFGINLRKSKMFSQSLEYYIRALKLSKHDENLYINIARVYLELKNYVRCAEYLYRALQVAPQSEIALKFLKWLEAKRLLSQDQAEAAKAAVEAAPVEFASPYDEPSFALTDDRLEPTA